MTLPASLPITTDFEPDPSVLRHRYMRNEYQLSDPGALLCELPDFEGKEANADADAELENTLTAFLCTSTLGFARSPLLIGLLTASITPFS